MYHLRKSAFVVFSFVVLASLGVFFHPSVAHAGTNGQEIYFTTEPTAIGTQACPSGDLQSVSISGINQNGVSSTWTGTSSDGRDVSTLNYWWVGNTTIGYQIGGTWYTEVVWIPQQADQGQYNADYAYINCKGNRLYAAASFQYSSGSGAAQCINIDLNGGNPLGLYTATRHIGGYKYVGKDGEMTSPPLLVADQNGNGHIIQITEITVDFLTYDCG